MPAAGKEFHDICPYILPVLHADTHWNDLVTREATNEYLDMTIMLLPLDYFLSLHYCIVYWNVMCISDTEIARPEDVVDTNIAFIEFDQPYVFMFIYFISTERLHRNYNMILLVPTIVQLLRMFKMCNMTWCDVL